MADLTAISWCDSTINLWVGCEKVGPGCDRCYAEAWSLRAGRDQLWKGARERTKTWDNMLKWQRSHQAFYAAHRRRRRVFVNSLSDFFDNAVPPEWRMEGWEYARRCKDLDLYFVTKRIPNVPKMLPAGGWNEENFGHIVLLITVVNQAEYDRDVPRLKALKRMYPWLRIGLSIEPMIGGIILDAMAPKLDWVIVGGESGPGARGMDPNWPEALHLQCDLAGIPFHFKQVGSNHTGWVGIKGKGDNPNEWPRPLRVRSFPYKRAA